MEQRVNWPACVYKTQSAHIIGVIQELQFFNFFFSQFIHIYNVRKHSRLDNILSKDAKRNLKICFNISGIKIHSWHHSLSVSLTLWQSIWSAFTTKSRRFKLQSIMVKWPVLIHISDLSNAVWLAAGLIHRPSDKTHITNITATTVKREQAV